MVSRGALAAVAALPVSGDALTPDRRVAYIIGARIGITAGNLAAGDAVTQVAVVSRGAHILVVAGSLVQEVEAPLDRVAGIVAADVVVVAVFEPRRRAGTICTLVAYRAFVAVVAFALVGQMNATFALHTTVIGAGVAVIAVRYLDAHTSLVRHADLLSIAEVFIAANQRFSRHATQCLVTGLFAIAGVAVVAQQFGSANALTGSTQVRGGADVTVVAWGLVVNVGAALLDQARVIRARIAVVAVGLDSSRANTLLALVPHGARISVFARHSLVVRLKRALPAVRRTGSLQADGIISRRFGTLGDGPRLHFALVWQGLHVAKESSIAKVPILQLRAIPVLLAVAVDGRSGAFAFLAQVGHGTGVAIIALLDVVFMHAASRRVAGIVGAGILIVAIHGLTNADPFFAVIRNGAAVPVKAFAAVDSGMLAPILAQTGIFGAEIFVVTSVFVQVAITVIVHAVADFLSGLRCSALRKPVLDAHPFALAGADIIAQLTWRPERQLDGTPSAWTLARVGNALLCSQPVNGHRIYT